MLLGETSDVRPLNCPRYNHLENSFDIITDELHKFIDEYNKLAQENKNW